MGKHLTLFWIYWGGKRMVTLPVGSFHNCFYLVFSFIFGLFKQTKQFLQQNNVKKFHPVSDTRIQTSPLVHETSPMTTRPVINFYNKFMQKCPSSIRC